MIAKLRGTVDGLGEDWVIIDVAGVGYLVFCSAQTLRALGGIGQEASLSIETHVREDHIHLYGFADASEKEWFGLLTTVQGVGAKVCLALLSALSPADISDAILSGDKAMLTQAQGVGPRLAARIIGELKDKADQFAVVRHVDFGNGTAAPAAGSGVVPDAVSALVNLGYRRHDALGAVSQAAQQLGADASVEALVKAGLQELSA